MTTTATILSLLLCLSGARLVFRVCTHTRAREVLFQTTFKPCDGSPATRPGDDLWNEKPRKIDSTRPATGDGLSNEQFLPERDEVARFYCILPHPCLLSFSRRLTPRVDPPPSEPISAKALCDPFHARGHRRMLSQYWAKRFGAFCGPRRASFALKTKNKLHIRGRQNTGGLATKTSNVTL